MTVVRSAGEVTALPSTHVDQYRDLGLAAGLAKVLDGLDSAAAAPQGIAVLPVVSAPQGARIVPNPIVAREGLSIVQYLASGTDGGLTGHRAAALAEVRLGLLARMLDLAVERLSGRTFAGVPLIDQQLVAGAVANVLTDLDLLAAAQYDDNTAADLHERVTEAGWTVTKLFGAEGYIADHPVRCLYVSALVADIWIPRR
jgi:hypothetical protein